jgi:hypothetical protein
MQLGSLSQRDTLTGGRNLTKGATTNVITDGIKQKRSSGYSAWLGKSVVLLIAIRQCHVPMPCCIIGESVAAVRVRIEPGFEMDLQKELILAVEEYVAGLDNWVN